MKFFDTIQFHQVHCGLTCQKCIHFQNHPTIIEKTYLGLTIMSSGFASVRDDDGICNLHQLYLSARDSCQHFELNEPELNKQ
jgi:hypothetical protein